MYNDLAELAKALEWTTKNCPNAPYVPIKREIVERLEARIKVLEEALHHISLGSQNSSTTKEHLGIYARRALGGEHK